jgi:hypothetical protein
MQVWPIHTARGTPSSHAPDTTRSALRQSSGASLLDEGPMLDKSSVSLMVAVLLCAALLAWSQDTLPEGNGKQAVQTYYV